MPNVPHHSTLPSQEDLIRRLIDNPKIPENITDLLRLQLEQVGATIQLHAWEGRSLLSFRHLCVMD